VVQLVEHLAGKDEALSSNPRLRMGMSQIQVLLLGLELLKYVFHRAVMCQALGDRDPAVNKTMASHRWP
jgi:hypothetical protein